MYQLAPESHRVAVGYIYKNMARKSKKSKTWNELKTTANQSESTFFKDMNTCALWGFWVSAGKQLKHEVRWFCAVDKKLPPKHFVFTTHHMSDLYHLQKSESMRWTHQVTVEASVLFQ